MKQKSNLKVKKICKGCNLDFWNGWMLFRNWTNTQEKKACKLECKTNRSAKKILKKYVAKNKFFTLQWMLGQQFQISEMDLKSIIILETNITLKEWNI